MQNIIHKKQRGGSSVEVKSYFLASFIPPTDTTSMAVVFLQWLLLVMFTITVALLLLKFLLLRNDENHKLPPSPWKLPLIGNLHQLGKNPHISLRNLSNKLGPIIYLQLGQVPTVVVSSARLAKEVFKTHDLALANRPHIFSAKHLFYNCTDIAFAPYGHYWRYVRKICILELLSNKRVQSFRPVMEEEAERMVQRIAQSQHGLVNLTKILGLYANDVICRVAFGRDFSGGGEYDKHGFQKMLQEYQELLGGFSLGDFFPSKDDFIHGLTGFTRRLQHTFDRFDKLFDEILQEHGRSTQGGSRDLIDFLLHVQNSNSPELPLTTDNVKAIILDMFAAGTDTTFIALDWGMTELIMNPRAMQEAQTQIRSFVGERKFVLESDLPHFHYLKAVIKEIFRMHPPAPLLVPRESMEEVMIDGYTIPAKTRFFVNAWAIGRDPESWENPESFEPERFLNSTIDFKGRDYELIPFGAGRRSCPAISLGTASLELALAQLLHSFDWQLPEGTQPEDLEMAEVFGITMHRAADLIVVAKPRFSL